MSPEEKERLIKVSKKRLELLPYYINDYMKYRSDISTNTLYNYVLDFYSFFSWLKEINNINALTDISISYLYELKKGDIEKYKDYCINNGGSTDTIARKLYSLKSLFNYLSNLVDHEIFSNIMNEIIISKKKINHKLKVKAIAETTFTPKEVDNFITFVEDHYENLLISEGKIRMKKSFLFNKERDLAILVLLFNTGLKISEALSIDIDVVDLNNKELEFLVNGDSITKIQFNDLVASSLEKYISIRSSRYEISEEVKPLFISRKTGNNGVSSRLTVRAAQNKISEYATSFNTPYLNCDIIRNTFAVNHYYYNKDIKKLSKIMRHSSTNPTKVYKDAAEIKYDI